MNAELLKKYTKEWIHPATKEVRNYINIESVNEFELGLSNSQEHEMLQNKWWFVNGEIKSSMKRTETKHKYIVSALNTFFEV